MIVMPGAILERNRRDAMARDLSRGVQRADGDDTSRD